MQGQTDSNTSILAIPDSLVEESAQLQDSLGEESLTSEDSLSAIREALTAAKQNDTVQAVSGVFDSLLSGLHEATGFSKEVLANLLVSALVVIALMAIRALVLRVAYRRTPDVRVHYQWRKTSAYVAVVVGAFLFFRIWVGAVGSLVTFFGLLSAGIAIALKDPLANFAGWLFIVWRRPFGPGDRVSIRKQTGDVIDQRVFMFTLLEVSDKAGGGQSTGRIIHVPNGWLFTDSIVNFTRGFPYIWNEMSVLVTFESDWRTAKQILLGIANEHGNSLSEDAERKLRRAAQEYLIFYSKLTPTVYTNVKDSGIELTMRYLVEPRRRRGSEQQVWEAILDAFAGSENIDFAYPTQRFFNNVLEGKPGTTPNAVHTPIATSDPAPPVP